MTLHIYVHRTRDAALPIYANFPVAEVSQQALRDWLHDEVGPAFALQHDPHVTVAWSQQPIHWTSVPPCLGLVVQPAARKLERWGKHAVLLLRSPELQKRWWQYRQAGASWDYPNYQPHLTLSTDPDFPLNLPAYDGPITLGPEQRATPKD